MMYKNTPNMSNHIETCVTRMESVPDNDFRYANILKWEVVCKTFPFPM